jgi:soluble lytic murein transglycosylase-like protein
MNTLSLAIMVAASTFQIPAGLLSAISYVESRHNPKAIHRHDGDGDSLGAFQIKFKTAKSLGFKGNEKHLQLPLTNAYWAALYLDHQRKRYGGDLRKAVAAYNAGSLKMNDKKQIRNIIYVTKVFSAWAEGK